MTITCKRCGATATGEQAFCPKCGAVIGMEGAPETDRPTPPNLAATIVGQHFNIPPPPPPKPKTPPTPTPAPATPGQQPAVPTAGAHGAEATRPLPPAEATAVRGEVATTRRGGGSKAALLVVAGFIAVMLIGGLLLLLLYIFLGR